jgi:hypothetical protein
VWGDGDPGCVASNLIHTPRAVRDSTSSRLILTMILTDDSIFLTCSCRYWTGYVIRPGMGITHFLAGSRAVGVGVARAHVPARHAARPARVSRLIDTHVT